MLRSVVSIEECEGILDRVGPKGIVLGGERLSFSKWFTGERPTEEDVGSKIRVVVDRGDKVSFLKEFMVIGNRAPGWKPPEKSEKGSWGGGGRRFSPEELELKKDEGIRIARSVAIDRAISMAEKGIQIEKIADLALAVEAYLLKGELPQGAKAPGMAPPQEPSAKAPQKVNPMQGTQEVTSTSQPPKKEAVPPQKGKPKRLAPQAVNTLFNEAIRGRLVKDWQGFVALVRSVLKVAGAIPYQLSQPDFERVATHVRSRLGQDSAA